MSGNIRTDANFHFRIEPISKHIFPLCMHLKSSQASDMHIRIWAGARKLTSHGAAMNGRQKGISKQKETHYRFW